jgi:hypothetical protein
MGYSRTLCRRITKIPEGNPSLMKNPHQHGFVTGHDFSRADKVNQIRAGFSPCHASDSSNQLCQQSEIPEGNPWLSFWLSFPKGICFYTLQNNRKKISQNCLELSPLQAQ